MTPMILSGVSRLLLVLSVSVAAHPIPARARTPEASTETPLLACDGTPCGETGSWKGDLSLFAIDTGNANSSVDLKVRPLLRLVLTPLRDGIRGVVIPAFDIGAATVEAARRVIADVVACPLFQRTPERCSARCPTTGRRA